MDDLIKNATKAPAGTSLSALRATATASVAARATADVASGVIETNHEFVSEDLLRPIREKCRADDFYIREAARYLLMNLQHKSWIVRIRTLNVIDALFVRSRLFREVICIDIRTVVDSGGLLGSVATLGSSGTRNDLTAREGLGRVASRVKELLELWDLQFGYFFPRLHAAARYLRESLRLAMPNLRARARVREEGAVAAEAANRRVLAARRDLVLAEVNERLDSIAVDIERMDDFLAVLFPAVEDLAHTRSQGITKTDPTSVDTIITASLSDGSDQCRKRKFAINIKPAGKRLCEQAAACCSEEKGNREDIALKDSTPEESLIAEEEDDLQYNPEDTITWEDAAEDNIPPASTDTTFLFPASLNVTEASALLAVVPPDGVEVSTAVASASRIRTVDNDAAVSATREHALHLSRSCLRTLRSWMQTLLQVQTQANYASDVPNIAVQHAVESTLRRVALLNARLYRVLTDSGQFFHENFLNM
jgi:hypothetical protein